MDGPCHGLGCVVHHLHHEHDYGCSVRQPLQVRDGEQELSFVLCRVNLWSVNMLARTCYNYVLLMRTRECAKRVRSKHMSKQRRRNLLLKIILEGVASARRLGTHNSKTLTTPLPSSPHSSFVDGGCGSDKSTGSIYFYASGMDQSMVDIESNPSVSFALSEASLNGDDSLEQVRTNDNEDRSDEDVERE